MYEQPKTFDDAKKMVASPAGVEFERYPLKFAIPAHFGARPQPGTAATVNRGTALLVRSGEQLFALTCSHVVEGYRQRLADGPCIFQLGDCELDNECRHSAENCMPPSQVALAPWLWPRLPRLKS